MSTRLVVQAHEIATEDLKQLAKLTAATRIQQVLPTAFALQNADQTQTETVKQYCAQAKLDWGFVPTETTLNSFGLVVMDMDSTLINIECIDEIADFCGIKKEISAITESAMRGQIDFRESLRRRVKLLAGLDESTLARVYDERLELNPGAELLIQTLKKHHIKTMLVSGGFTFFTDKLKARLGLDFTLSNQFAVQDGKLTGAVLGDIIDAQRKADELVRMREQLGLQPEQVIAIGDGANDLAMMAVAGVSFGYHAKPIVQEKTTYQINHVGLEAVIGLLNPPEA